MILVVKRLMITKNAVVKIQTLIMNHESRPVKLNPVEIHFSKVFKTKKCLIKRPYSSANALLKSFVTNWHLGSGCYWD